jgi:hypothetical protein
MDLKGTHMESGSKDGEQQPQGSSMGPVHAGWQRRDRLLEF